MRQRQKVGLYENKVLLAERHGLFLAAADGARKSLVLSEEELYGEALEKRDAQKGSLAFDGPP